MKTHCCLKFGFNYLTLEAGVSSKLQNSGNYETRSSKIANENATYRAEFERSFNYLRFVAACSKIADLAIKLERFNCSHWFYSEHSGEYQSKLCTEHALVGSLR